MKQSYIHQIKKARKLTIVEMVTLSVFLTVVLLMAFTPFIPIENNKALKFKLGLFTAGTVLFLINTTSFANRFTNITFSLIWFVLSTLLIVFGLNAATPLNCVPLLEFFLYQILRFIFWKNYYKEFIPADIYRNTVSDHYSEGEDLNNDKYDKSYMKWMQWLGAIIFIVSTFFMVGFKL
jgi:hypothetical protein